jgi:hypothetical protein
MRDCEPSEIDRRDLADKGCGATRNGWRGGRGQERQGAFRHVSGRQSISITFTVPAASIIVHPNWGGSANIGNGYDLAIIPLTDQVSPVR